MKDLLKNKLKHTISYTDYRALVKEKLINNESTTENGSEALVHYSMLNDKRMDRLDKKIELTQDIIESAKHAKKQTWIILTEGWCGDAAQNIPVLNKIAESTDNIDSKIILRDQHLDLMNQFLTNGGQSIPKLIAINEEHEVLYTWGPRPSTATKMVKDYKAKHGKLDDEFKTILQKWYNKDKGVDVMNDFLKLLTP